MRKVFDAIKIFVPFSNYHNKLFLIKLQTENGSDHIFHNYSSTTDLTDIVWRIRELQILYDLFHSVSSVWVYNDCWKISRLTLRNIFQDVYLLPMNNSKDMTFPNFLYRNCLPKTFKKWVLLLKKIESLILEWAIERKK